MNSDPYDSAGWRTLGMLDADESAIFDEAMRHDPLLHGAYLEMNRLTAAIAAATSIPVEPRAGQLDRLQSRLKLNPAKRAYLWIGISGWAAAAVFALLLLLNRNANTGRPGNDSTSNPNTSSVAPGSPAPADNRIPFSTPAVSDSPKSPQHTPATAETGSPDSKATAKVETKRLVQEIEVLRDNLEKFQHRDRVLFEPVPGMALPIVMRMSPPGLNRDESLALERNEDDHAPITTMLGDALRVMTTTANGTPEADPKSVAPVDPTATPVQPTAIPIYDAARDSGTLVVSNLPAAEIGKVYNLWVTTANGAKPIYVGSLPASSASGADSFDFSLGSNMVLPSGFLLTKDPLNAPANPSETNTVLEGPPTPIR